MLLDAMTLFSFDSRTTNRFPLQIFDVEFSREVGGGCVGVKI